MKKVKKGRVTLIRALSKLGIASRVEAEALVLSGQVKVHGTIEKNPNRSVNPDSAHIEVLGKKAKKGETIVVLFHKPNSCLTTKRDPEGRKTIYDFLPKEFHSLHPVGRLDMHTTGLLLLTNDTRFSSYMTDPVNEIPRTYVVTVRGEVLDEGIKKMTAGLRVDGDELRAKDAKILKASGKESRLEITLLEGKNREIRRLCLAIGNEVIALKRISFGEYDLGALKAGEYNEVHLKNNVADRTQGG